MTLLLNNDDVRQLLTMELLAQDPHLDRWPIRRRDLLGEERRDPVAPHQLAHRRPRHGPGDQLVFFLGQHGNPPGPTRRD